MHLIKQMLLFILCYTFEPIMMRLKNITWERLKKITCIFYKNDD